MTRTNATSSPMHLEVGAAEAGARLDRFLADRLPGLGRRGAARLLQKGAVSLERPGGAPLPLRKATLLAPGDRVHVAPSETQPLASAPDAPPTPQLLPTVSVVYEDAALVVLAKPPGVPSHPLAPGETGTLASHLAARYPETLAVGGPAREAGLAHRLDTLTSGLLVAARTTEAYGRLRAAFREHRVDKAYLALVTGAPPDAFTVDAPIASRRGRRRVTVGREAGQPAETRVQVLVRYAGAALVQARTRFGRRHQVRAHLADADHPLVADPLYGTPQTALPGPWPLLHASELAFDHPITGERLTLTLALPHDVQAALDRLDPLID